MRAIINKKGGQVSSVGIATDYGLDGPASKFRKMVSCGMPKIPASVNTELDKTITMEELLVAVKKGKQHKSPGHDGICHEFFKRMWDVVKHDMLKVINHTYMEGLVSDAQKHGRIVCLPKKSRTRKPGRL